MFIIYSITSLYLYARIWIYSHSNLDILHTYIQWNLSKTDRVSTVYVFIHIYIYPYSSFIYTVHICMCLYEAIRGFCCVHDKYPDLLRLSDNFILKTN